VRLYSRTIQANNNIKIKIGLKNEKVKRLHAHNK